MRRTKLTSSGPRLRILVVDDSNINRRVLQLFLEKTRLDCDVQVADEGATAVAAATETKFDLVLMALYMHAMDGLEATAKIREHEEATGSRRTPVVGVVANAPKKALPEGLMDGLLLRPISFEDLTKLVEKFATFEDQSGSWVVVESDDDVIALN
ncbi:CheY-like protein [Thozetella sp. PMI_491]|nr:CheY-like protein [Thozetella sp. PMI_491]